MNEALSVDLLTRSDYLVWTETLLFAVINVAAFFGNLSVCCAVYRNQRLRTLANMFVVALAVSDILMSTCCMPFSVATLFRGRWIFGTGFCRFHGFGVFTFGLASLHTMGIIAVSRYFCIVKPEKYIVLFKTRKKCCTSLLCGVRLSLDPCLHFPLKTVDLNSSRGKQCACTLFKPTLLTQPLLNACM